MRYVSIFSGIEAASLAWMPLSWEPVAFAEVDPFACAVLAHHFPNVPNLGDVTQINWEKFNEQHGAIDIVVGGSPCQSFSIAGGRESLDGESRLMYEYIRAVCEIRPCWFLWENVPGVLSTRDNAFGQLLDALENIGYGMAWRTLDAQFFGVAQRRRRVFLVGYRGNLGAAAAVLFERESVSGNTQSSREKRSELAAESKRRTVICVGNNTTNASIDYDQAGTLQASSGIAPFVVSDAFMLQNDTTLKMQDLQGAENTLKAAGEIPVICMASAASNAEISDDGSSPTLLAIHEHPIVCMADDNAKAAIDVDISGSLKVGVVFR